MPAILATGAADAERWRVLGRLGQLSETLPRSGKEKGLEMRLRDRGPCVQSPLLKKVSPLYVQVASRTHSQLLRTVLQDLCSVSEPSSAAGELVTETLSFLNPLPLLLCFGF